MVEYQAVIEVFQKERGFAASRLTSFFYSCCCHCFSFLYGLFLTLSCLEIPIYSAKIQNSLGTSAICENVFQKNRKKEAFV